MGTEFTIDDAFVLEGEEEDVVPGEDEGEWKGREKDGGGEMMFGPLSFAKTQTSGPTGTPEHSNLKYQNLENEDALGGTVNSSFNNFFKIRWTSHPLVKKNRRVVLASFLLLITGVALIFTGIVIQLNPHAGVSSAIFFVPGFLLFIPGVYHVIYISCAVRGRRGFKFFYLPYFEK
ncbi:transmembrane protein 134-like [Sinocyclocheilus grahami]|uniref:Transmembrane protein 134-like n=1 Tax=Sinocyclocheilus grahami TaxID=75366 RepID=A0A672SMX1_SINGR|nr:PREDICTED: transmembrane protein 134-like [Sinocyclocheilus grahami]